MAASTTVGRWTVAVALGATLAAQILLILPLSGLSLGGAVLLGALAIALWVRRPSTTVEMLVVTAGIGGMGMLCGAYLDMQGSVGQQDAVAIEAPAAEPELPPCHARVLEAEAAHEGSEDEAAAEAPEFSWAMAEAELGSMMTLLMLVTCVPSCLLLCRTQGCTSRWRHAGLHLCATLTMLVGMFAGGWWLGPVLSGWGLDALAAAHLAMLIGMLVGVALGSLPMASQGPPAGSEDA